MSGPAEIDSRVVEVCRAIAAAGGRSLLVGGFVRDRLLGLPSKDYDVEVFRLPLGRLETTLAAFGEVIAVGRAFGVLRIKGIDCDFSLPRREQKTGAGHRGFLVETDEGLDFAEASRRRDLTINSMGLDPLTGELLDPHGGRRDLRRRVLRATDEQRFVEDPLRGLRVAQLAARLEMRADDRLLALCAGLDLSELPGERQYQEFRKLLLRGRRPSLGLGVLERTGLLRFYPELQALVGVPQDPDWHPEGDVWVHTAMVVDAAARERVGNDREDRLVMFAALCHDFGKPAATVEREGRIRSPSHEPAGVEPTYAFLRRLRAAEELARGVAALVRHHLAPANLVSAGSTDRAYRRLARQLERAGVDAELLHRVARADHLGRTTADARAGRFTQGDEFLRRMESLEVATRAVPDAVLGRHLIARGLEPGPSFGPILARCRELQDETGWRDPERILEAALRGISDDRRS